MSKPTIRLETAVSRLAAHADALIQIPSGEPYIGHLQSVLYTALHDIKKALEAIQSELDRKKNKS